ncbi:MAG: class I SAM-dependent methyltransferase [Sphingorhabdus sp.]
MTSRDITRLWVQPDASIEHSLADKLAVCAYGAIQWPWLLRSLRGGRPKDKAALLDRLGLPPHALPNLGSWKADTVFLAHIVSAVEDMRPAQVVELGCGASTLVIGKALALHGGGRLSSFDQHAEFVRTTGDWLDEHGVDVDLHYAPLGPAPGGWPGHWYQLEHLPPVIDLLVIDGPPWAIHPLVRGAADSLFERISIGGTILLDDAARPGERAVARRWRERWPGFEFVLDRRGTKGTLIGHRRA